MNEDRDLWLWVIRRFEIGVFYAGYGIGKEPGDVWNCHGCKAEYCSDSGHRDQYDSKEFPHEPDCKYLAILQRASEPPSGGQSEGKSFNQ